MSQKLTIVARIEANADKVELVKAELLKLIAKAGYPLKAGHLSHNLSRLKWVASNRGVY